MNKIRNWITNIILLTVAVIISLMLAEGVVRLIDMGCFSSNQPFSQNLGIWKTDPIIGHDFVENHPKTNFIFKDYEFSIWTNEIGCFDKPYSGEKDFILSAGDSFTWGYSPFEYTYGSLLESRLGERVLKCGMPGFGSREEFLKIQKVIQKAGNIPKLIIVGYFMNDIDSDYTFPQITVINGYRIAKIFISDQFTGKKEVRTDDELRERLKNFLKYGSTVAPSTLKEQLKSWLSQHSAFYDLIEANTTIREIARNIGLVKDQTPQRFYDNSQSLFLKDAEKFPWINEAWELHLNNFREIKHIADNAGSKLLVVNIPPKEIVYKFVNPAFDNAAYERADKKIAIFFKKEGIAFLDLETGFIKYSNQKPRKELNSEKDLYWRCDPHMNIKGNRLAGLLISKFVLENRLVDVKDITERLALVTEELEGFK